VVARHLCVERRIHHRAFLRARLVAAADADGRLAAPVYRDVRHICGNEQEIAGLRDLAVLQIVASPLLRSLQDDFSGTPAGSRCGPLQHVARNSERSFLLGTIPIRKRSGFYMKGNRPICFVDVVSAEVSDRPLHDRLVLLRRALRAVIGSKFRQAAA
jgi:hypothetical protein